MKFVKIGLSILVLLVAIVAVAAPIGPLPGFFIRGTPTEVPATWPDTSSVHEIKLQVNGTLPRVVIIWVIEHANDLYVVGAAESGWVTMIGEGAPVKMRLEDATYDLTAERVTDNLEAIATAYMDKYRADYPDIVASFPSAAEVNDDWRIYRLK